MLFRALEGDDTEEELGNDDDQTNQATRKEISIWLGSDPSTLSVRDSPAFNTLPQSQKEFAVVALANPPALYYLSGRAGFGKSHLPRSIVDAYCLMGQRVAVTGTTASATGNIGGVTIHKNLQLSRGFESRLDPSNPLWPALKTIHVVIIDEISMATAHLLMAMDHVLRRVALPGQKRLTFGGRTIIAIEGLCQLPPVPPRLFGVVYNNCAVYVCMS